MQKAPIVIPMLACFLGWALSLSWTCCHAAPPDSTVVLPYHLYLGKGGLVMMTPRFAVKITDATMGPDRSDSFRGANSVAIFGNAAPEATVLIDEPASNLKLQVNPQGELELLRGKSAVFTVSKDGTTLTLPGLSSAFDLVKGNPCLSIEGKNLTVDGPSRIEWSADGDQRTRVMVAIIERLRKEASR